MKKDWISYVRLYAFLLIVLGLFGYVSNPEKAITSLILASGVGLCLYLVTTLPKRILQTKWAGMSLGLFFLLYGGLVLIRSFFTWNSWAQGAEAKLVPSLLLTTISFFSFIVFYFLIKSCPNRKK